MSLTQGHTLGPQSMDGKRYPLHRQLSESRKISRTLPGDHDPVFTPLFEAMVGGMWEEFYLPEPTPEF